MPRISFHSRMSLVEDYQVLDIYIDQINLIDWLGNIELPQAMADEIAYLAGAYEGLPPLMTLPPAKHFFGESHHEYQHKSRTALLEYAHSGVPGEWTFAVEIVTTKSHIIWRKPTNIQRPNWKYEPLEELEFDRIQYHEALLLAKQNYINN